MASARQYKAKVTIGGAVSSSFKAMLGSAADGLARIGDVIKEVDSRQKLLGRSIQEFGRLGKDVSAMRDEYGQLARQAETLRGAQARLLAVEKARAANQERMRELWGRVPGGAMLGAAAGALGIGAALSSFEDLDDATTNLRVALMDSTGGVPARFARIRQEAIQLGNVLPGTTADFMNVAVALKEQGTSVQAIAGGALQAASYLGVVLKMPVEQAAEMTAKLREAFQLSEGELGKMADLSQRAKYAYGLTPDDLLLGAKYYGGKLGSLGLSGAGNVRKVYALQGIAAQNGMDGSTFGTNFGQMLSRVALLQDKLHKQSKEMKAVNATLAKYHIQLQFFDKNGKFAGIDNMVAQLQQLNRLTQQQRLTVLQRLFGEEGMRPAELIGRKGVAGYDAALAAADGQASLQQRIGVAMGSFRNKLEALQGTVENFTADAITPLAQALMPLMDTANNFAGGTLQNWVDGHQRLLGAVELGTAGLLSFKAAALPAKLNAGFVVATRGLTALRTAMLALDAGALLNPVGLIVAGIAVAIGAGALVIRKYWGPVTAFFGGIGAGIAEAFKPLAPWLKPFEAGLQAIGGYVREIWNWFGQLARPVHASSGELKQAAELGHKFGHVLGDALNYAIMPLNLAVAGVEWLINNAGAAIKAVESIPSPGRAWHGISGWWRDKVAGPDGAAAGALPLPAMAPAGTGAPPVTDGRQYNIHVYQQPGQDSKAFADEVLRRLKEHQGMVQRGLLYDPAGA